MDFWFSIRKECYSVSGHKTMTTCEIVRLPYDKGIEYLKDKTIIREWKNPFNSSITNVVIE